MTLIVIACVNKPIRIQEVVMPWLNCVFEIINYKVILVGTCWYWVSVWRYWLGLGGTGSV